MKLKNCLLLLAATLAGTTAGAQNPFVQTRYTADPAPMVKGDTLYVYADVDEPGADFFWMYQWRVYSTTDMVNWTDHGQLMGFDTFKWADDRAWATQCIERNGKYYWYVCAHDPAQNAMAIGVAVGDTPVGPFSDALGHPLYVRKDDWSFIDPTVFIDDKDGQAWLAWGNPRNYYVKLNDDMISFKGEVDTLELTQGKDRYVEGPWLTKRNKNYYMFYAAGGVPEHIAYSMAKKPTGPWKYMGTVMAQTNATNAFTNHCGVVDFKGHSYFFYHTGNLPGGGGFDRSMAVEEFKYNKDGTVPEIKPTREGVEPIGTLNPYQTTKAVTIANSYGLSTDQNLTDVYLSEVNNGDWMCVREVDFGGKVPTGLIVEAASATHGGIIEIHADSIGGDLLATVNVEPTGSWENWTTFKAPVTSGISGKHDLFFAFKGQKGRKLMNVNTWKFF